MKKLIAIVLALVMVLSLGACTVTTTDPTTPPTSGNENPTTGNDNPTTDTTPVAQDVNITLWTYPIGGWGKQETVDSLLAGFNAQYPNIHVTVEYLDYTNGDDKVNTAIEGGAHPDLIMEGPERLVANWGEKGLMVDLSDLLDDTDIAEINPAALTACYATNGEVYEYPVVMTAHCMAINKTVFEAAGAMQYIDEATHTWKSVADFEAAIAAVYEYTGAQVGAVYCVGQGGDQGTRALVTNMYGGTYANAEHTEYTANCAENVKALETIVAQKGINFDPAIVASDEIQLFVNGTLAMAFCWNVAQETNNAEMLGFDAFPLCFPTESGDPKLQGGIWGFGIFNNGDEAKIAAAKDFVAFMTEDDAQYAKAVEATSYWPTREVAGMYDGNDMMTEYGIMVPYMGDYYQITKGWTTARTEWWNALQRIGAGGNVQTELDTFVTNANAAAAAEG